MAEWRGGRGSIATRPFQGRRRFRKGRNTSMVKRENQHRAHRRIVIGITIALLGAGVTGCAGPTTETRVVSTDPAASSSSAAGLSGTWHGFVFHPGADD